MKLLLILGLTTFAACPVDARIVMPPSASPATLNGFARVAKTEHGKQLVAFLDTSEFEVRVVEDANEGGAGRAPQPGLATLVASRDHSIVKSYEIILNPTRYTLPAGMIALPNQASTPTDLMAAAWAAELLHTYFYARGISLPHHDRDDFQEWWSAMARELGFPALQHSDEEESFYGRVFVIGAEEKRGKRFEGRGKR